jgi:23S rRNA (uracil1939-C5)-methyltransferase
VAVSVDALVDVQVEKPAAGGRMIARHEGEILLVAGAIPGERVTARVTKAEKRVAFAETVAVIEPSPDRREPGADPACGGCLYAHIAYTRQVELKAQIIEDAFVRIGRIPLAERPRVQSGPERGYRMRARFHVRDGRVGFYLEGTHRLCDPRATGQLMEGSVDAVDAAITAMATAGVTVLSAELSENIGGNHRALHVDTAVGGDLDRALEIAVATAGLTGATARAADGTTASSGDPIVTDTLAALTGGRATDGILRRHPEAFFQGNRFLIDALVGAVMDVVPAGRVLDLYAGVGLFSVSLAAAGRAQVTAVEGDPVSGRDLERNAAQFGDRVRVARSSVEAYLLGRRASAPDTLIVDPPRTGMSKEAGEAIARAGAKRIVYVSCDAPTMARDARRLLDAGYRLVSLEGFDLFPNTPHVESLGVFERNA